MAKTRNRAIHFDARLEQELRDRALIALRLLDSIIASQFGVSDVAPWLFTASGSTYVRISDEALPFVRLFYLPNCALVSARHTIEFEGVQPHAYDAEDDGSGELSDEAYAEAINVQRRLTQDAP